MCRLLPQFWPILALRGVLAILIGVLALLRPRPTLLALAALFAAFALLSGMVSVIGAFSNRKSNDAAAWPRRHRCRHNRSRASGVDRAVSNTRIRSVNHPVASCKG